MENDRVGPARIMEALCRLQTRKVIRLRSELRCSYRQPGQGPDGGGNKFPSVREFHGSMLMADIVRQEIPESLAKPEFTQLCSSEESHGIAG
jgi:hypothetical protein